MFHFRRSTQGYASPSPERDTSPRPEEDPSPSLEVDTSPMPEEDASPSLEGDPVAGNLPINRWVVHK